MGRDPVMGCGRFLAGHGTYSQKYKMSLNCQFIGYFVKKYKISTQICTFLNNT